MLFLCDTAKFERSALRSRITFWVSRGVLRECRLADGTIEVSDDGACDQRSTVCSPQYRVVEHQSRADVRTAEDADADAGDLVVGDFASRAQVCRGVCCPS
jgi:hypothetical protein